MGFGVLLLFCLFYFWGCWVWFRMYKSCVRGLVRGYWYWFVGYFVLKVWGLVLLVNL